MKGDSYYAPNTLNSAKLESGLDNSPMWDDMASSKKKLVHDYSTHTTPQSHFGLGLHQDPVGVLQPLAVAGFAVPRRCSTETIC